jgi:hypothetical protein
MIKDNKFLLPTTTTIFIALALLAGCGQNASEISFKSGGMTHTFAEGKGAVPKDFPLPVYPNSTTTGSVSAEGGSNDERAKFLLLASKDPVDQVSKYYADELKAGGWKLEGEQKTGNLVNLSASQGAIEANVMVSGGEGNTTISLSVSKNTDGAPAQSGDAQNFEPNKLTPPTD